MQQLQSAAYRGIPVSSGLPAISTQELGEKYDTGKSVIIDVRSCIEYDVIHPVNALHILVSEIVFQKRTQEIIDQNPEKTIAFYCNGVTYLKSYEAARKMIADGCETCLIIQEIQENA